MSLHEHMLIFMVDMETQVPPPCGPAEESDQSSSLLEMQGQSGSLTVSQMQVAVSEDNDPENIVNCECGVMVICLVDNYPGDTEFSSR